MTYTFTYLPKRHQIVIKDTDAKNGIVLTNINNVGDGMAKFLMELVSKANIQEKSDANIQ